MKISGDDEDNVIVVSGAIYNQVNGFAGDDRITTSGDVRERQWFRGGRGNDYLEVGNSSVGRGAWFDGGPGRDTMVGGNANDIFDVSPGDIVLDATAGDGDYVTVRGIFSYTLPRNIETLQLQGGAMHGRGNRLDNYISAYSGNNVLEGARGNDTLQGWGGFDTLDGGLGSDRLACPSLPGDFAICRYDSVHDSVKASGVDHLYRIAEDGSNYRLDLSAVDANSATARRNEAFVFIGDAAFGADATGQVRYQVIDSDSIVVYVSTDADADAEMQINLAAVVPPVLWNFIL